MTEDHQLPQRSPQGGPQARRKALARQAGRVRGRGRGPARGRRRRRLARVRALRGVGQRARRASRSRRTCSPTVSQLGLRHARDRRLPAALVARRSARAASRCGASATPATSARSSAPRSRSARRRVALGPGSADPYGPQGRARVDGRAVLRARRARARRSPSCPAARSRSSPARASRCTSSVDGDVTLVVGAEREGLPRRRRRRLRRRRPHPDRPRRLAERRHGGHRRPLRAN